MKEQQKGSDDMKKYIATFIAAMSIFLGQDYLRSRNTMYKEYVTVGRYEEFKKSMEDKMGKIDGKLDKIIDRMLSGAK